MTTPRHVGLNVLYLVPGEVGGSEIYAHELIEALARARPECRFTVFCGREATPDLRSRGWPANVRLHPMPVDARNKPARILTEVLLLPGAAARAGVDVLHSLGTTSPPLVPGRASVVTILDLIYEAHPSTFPASARLGLKALVGPAARRADRVITISQAVKDDVVARLGLPENRVDPVLLGNGVRTAGTRTDGAVLRERLELGDARVLLCVSAALVHKNLPRLLRAFARLDAGHDDCVLVVVGHHGLEHERLAELARELGVDHRVRLTGWTEDADLEGLYGLASLCVYPSLYEGFGMPVLEAMTRGVPLACSDATSLPEVAGDAAALFDPEREADIVAVIERLLADPAEAERLRSRGRDRAATFTWEACALGVLATYEAALLSRAS